MPPNCLIIIREKIIEVHPLPGSEKIDIWTKNSDFLQRIFTSSNIFSNGIICIKDGIPTFYALTHIEQVINIFSENPMCKNYRTFQTDTLDKKLKRNKEGSPNKSKIEPIFNKFEKIQMELEDLKENHIAIKKELEFEKKKHPVVLKVL